jgi:hypothetical protein
MVGMEDSLNCLAMGVARVKILATAQVFRLKAEGYKTSHKARINPFQIFNSNTPRFV